MVFLAAAAAINLVCSGGGAHRVATTAYAAPLGDPGNGVTVSGTRHVAYEDEVELQLDGDQGRIRVPNGVKPRVRSGGDDGWWKLTDVRVAENEIRAKFGLNFMNHPTVVIDRISGHISIEGRSGSFSGYCEPYDPANVERKF